MAAAAAADAKTAPATGASAGAGVGGASGGGSEWMEMRTVAGAGKGWFATRAVPAGTVLLLERGMHSPPYRPSVADEKARAMDELTRQFCAAGALNGCNELSFGPAPLEAGVRVTGSGALLVPTADPAYSDEQWSEARARIRTNAFQQIVPFAELPLYKTADQLRAEAEHSAAERKRAAAANKAHSEAFAEALMNPEKKPPLPQTYPLTKSAHAELWELMVVWPRLARFNHSCWPNVALVSGAAGSSTVCDMMAVTLRDVPAGAQLCISYYDELSVRPRAYRQQRLTESHQFACRCERCGPGHAAVVGAATPTAAAPAPAEGKKKGKKKAADSGAAGAGAAAGALDAASRTPEQDEQLLERTVPLLKKTELKRLETEVDVLKRSGERERTTTGVTGAIRAWAQWRADGRAKALPVTHWVQFQAREALWRLLLTFHTAAVAHNDVKNMFTAEHRALAQAVVIDELTAMQQALQTYDTRKRIFYVASQQFAPAVAWEKHAPAALIKHYAHVIGWWKKAEDKGKALSPTVPDAPAGAIATTHAPATATAADADAAAPAAAAAK